MNRRSLTARGMACLVAGILLAVAANVATSRPLLYVAVLLIALPLISALSVFLPRRSGDVTRVISTDLLAVGEVSRVSVRVDLRAGRPTGTWRDTLPPAVRGDAHGEYPGENETLRYDLEGVRRGISTLGPLVLRTVDGFGLAQREQAFGDTRTITVVPQVLALPPPQGRGWVSLLAANHPPTGSLAARTVEIFVENH